MTRIHSFYDSNFVMRLQGGKFLTLSDVKNIAKIDHGFPKGRGALRVDTTIIGAEGYKLPRLLDLTPLGSDNIDDVTKVIINQS